jgi:DNA-directed RNA polymerase subunit RPC12/RpoP
MVKEFLMHCDHCGRKVIVRDPTGIAGLKEVPLASIPGGVPVLDPEEKKIKTKKSIPRRRMFKCAICGRGIMLRENMVPMSEHKEEINYEEDNRFGREGSPFGPQVS